jgi:RNA polymerase sigma-B factor
MTALPDRPEPAPVAGPPDPADQDTADPDNADRDDNADQENADPGPDPEDDLGVEPYRPLVPLLARLSCTAPDAPGRRALREELATGFLPVVRHIARRYRGRGEPVDDLEQVGTIGLLNAIDRFAPTPDVDLLGAFLGYAVPTITGEMRRHFRDRTWSMRVPRRLKDLQGPIREAVATLSHSLGRAPRPTEIATHVGISVEEAIDALGAHDAYTPTSLDTLAIGTDTSLGDSLGRADAALDRVEYRHALRRALDALPARERKILVLRFFGELTQTDIAEQVGISQMHVSRLLARTLAALRTQVGAEEPAPGPGATA